MSRHLLRAAVAAALLVAAACRPAGLTPPGGLVTAQAERFALHGQAEFTERLVQIAPDALKRLATVTLIDASNRTVAISRTDAAGAFTLLPGSTFTATAGDIFYLDAYKGTRDNAVGADVARMRTILQWTTTGWKSVSGAGVVINPLTTAVCVIQGLVPGSVPATATLDTVSGSTVTTANGTLNGNWSALHALVRDLLAKDQDPLARVAYRDSAFRIAANLAAPLVVENFRPGSFSDTRLDSTGRLLLAPPRPTPNDPTSEIDYFSCAGMAPDSAGAITTDGTYLYVKAWSSYTNDGGNNTSNQTIKRIGTGFNGTIRGANYGTVGQALPAVSISLAYHKGFIYSPYTGYPNQLLQISATTGATTRIDLPVPLLNYYDGGSGGHHLITSDGSYLYNLAWGINGTANAGYTVHILDPDQGFKVVRKFTMDTTSYYTDGVYCDGTYLYPQEWNGGTTALVRRYRLSDGAREAEWSWSRVNDWSLGPLKYNPNVNNPIGACWDPYNRVFWTGNLTNEKVHLMRGGNVIPTGTWTSATIDAGTVDPHFGRLTWLADETGKGCQLSFQVRSADTTGALSSATWYGPTGTSDYYTASGIPLNPVHAKHRYLQVRATLGASTDLLTSPTLSRLSVEVMP